MKAVLTYRSQSVDISVDAYGFKWVDFKGIQIVSGDKYYVDKAVSLGAIKPKRKAKSED